MTPAISYPSRSFVNLCYCDETGTGDEPIAVMVGVLVDASRMHLTKKFWEALLASVSREAGHHIVELHTRDFYAGNGLFRGMSGPVRSNIISMIFDWLIDRKHDIVYSAVRKDDYFRAFSDQRIPDELNTIWRFLGFHLILAMQKYSQREHGVKGHTIFVFDNEERERMRFTDLIARPPAWSDEYYSKRPRQEQLDQIVDVPYFGDSKEVALIQFADFAAFFLRRYAEIKEQLVGPRYDEEDQKVTRWVQTLMQRSIGSNFIYPKRGKGYAEDLFYDVAPPSIRDHTWEIKTNAKSRSDK